MGDQQDPGELQEPQKSSPQCRLLLEGAQPTKVLLGTKEMQAQDQSLKGAVVVTGKGHGEGTISYSTHSLLQMQQRLSLLEAGISAIEERLSSTFHSGCIPTESEVVLPGLSEKAGPIYRSLHKVAMPLQGQTSHRADCSGLEKEALTRGHFGGSHNRSLLTDLRSGQEPKDSVYKN